MAPRAAGAFAEARNGDVAEIAAYSRAFAQDEEEGLIAHLVDKWGL